MADSTVGSEENSPPSNKFRVLAGASIAVGVFALIMLVAVGVMALVKPDVLAELRTIASPPAASLVPCDWWTEYNQDTAGRPGSWSAQASPYAAGGMTQLETGVVHIDPATPCADLASVITHEAQHVKQGNVYGGRVAAESALAQYGGIEINADCASRYLMGSGYFPAGGDSSPYTSGPCAGEQLRAGVATATGHRV